MSTKPTSFNKQGFQILKFISKVELADSLKNRFFEGVENCHWNYEFDGLINPGHANLAFQNQSLKVLILNISMHLIQYSFKY
jgi:hypothetical protein